jgi:Family of unknown function (DUF5990)
MTVRFRIVGTDLPGRSCAPSPERSDGYRNIHVGVQRNQEVIDLAPGDAARVEFEFDVPVRRGRFAGPFVHGRGGQRFIYLSWGELDGEEFRMFRRAKLHLDGLDPTSVDGRVVEGALSLTDAKGNPLCASVRPPRLNWTVR